MAVHVTNPTFKDSGARPYENTIIQIARLLIAMDAIKFAIQNEPDYDESYFRKMTVARRAGYMLNMATHLIENNPCDLSEFERLETLNANHKKKGSKPDTERVASEPTDGFQFTFPNENPRRKITRWVNEMMFDPSHEDSYARKDNQDPGRQIKVEIIEADSEPAFPGQDVLKKCDALIAQAFALVQEARKIQDSLKKFETAK